MDRYDRWALAVIVLWAAVCVATIDYNGPFFDEAIYVTAGERTFQGFGLSDNYLGWFAGSLIWPVLAAAGYVGDGLIGTRLVALLFATLAFTVTVRATRNLFGGRASLWTAIALAACAPLMALARLGVYDLPALLGIAVSFWSITELQRHNHRAWLIVAAASFTLGVFSKYPPALMALPLMGVLWALRGRRAWLDIPIFAMVSLAIALAFFLPQREALGPTLLWHAQNAPAFGATRLMIAYDLALLIAPALVLGLVGWRALRQGRRLPAVLLLSLALWPAYHLYQGNPVSSNKHIVYSFLFAYPLAGVGLEWLWSKRRILAVLAAAALLALAAVEVDRFDRGWPDVRPPANYLLAHVQPGDRLLINDSWPYTMYLYDRGVVSTPWNIYDAYRVTHEPVGDICSYDWFVDEGGSYAWPAEVAEAIRTCGAFEPVYSFDTAVVGLGSNLRYIAYNVHTTIWRNTAKENLP